MNDDFYIGYETPVPARARPLVLGAAAAALGAALAAAAIIVANLQPFAEASFAFGQHETYTGIVRLDPYPALDTGSDRFWLVSPGKRGADDEMRAVDGRVVQLEGALISRAEGRMLEVAPGSVHPAAPGPAIATPGAVSLGEVTLEGEVVDAKCFLGVMNPGEGTVHRDCAVACLRGGLPAALRVRSAAGETALIALVSDNGGSMSRAVADLAGRPVSVTGRLEWRPPNAGWALHTTVARIRTK